MSSWREIVGAPAVLTTDTQNPQNQENVSIEREVVADPTDPKNHTQNPQYTQNPPIEPSFADSAHVLHTQYTRAAWRQKGVTPTSRGPLIPATIRSKIEAVEAQARALDWPAELLWSCEFWGSPRGLAAVLDESDTVTEVAADYIVIGKPRGVLRFQRRVS